MESGNKKERRALMLFTKCGQKDRGSLIKYLQKLENNVENNVEFYNVIVDEDNVIAKNYKINVTPTIILLNSVDDKDGKRLVGNRVTIEGINRLLKRGDKDEN